MFFDFFLKENLTKSVDIFFLLDTQSSGKYPCICVIFICISSIFIEACAKTYSDSFTNGVTLASQCAAWQAFTSSLTCSSYSKMRLYGSNDPTGITVTDAATVTALAVALRYNTTIIAPSNGVQWRVWPCSGGYEISSTGTACSNPIGYVIRPCWPNGYWGGIMTANYPGPTQTMSISFE
ncbi:hypothetical protein I4U23_015208 [Adineta vaga]|nr:hypothetical protein I4U23_015208 [Adineta vaga]